MLDAAFKLTEKDNLEDLKAVFNDLESLPSNFNHDNIKKVFEKGRNKMLSDLKKVS